jgi:hypothetical protein
MDGRIIKEFSGMSAASRSAGHIVMPMANSYGGLYCQIKKRECFYHSRFFKDQSVTEDK